MIEKSAAAMPGADRIPALCHAILKILLRHGRALEPDEHDGYTPQLEQLQVQIARNETLLMVLPAFPCKSPNLSKVLGDLPDMAERVALRFLERLCHDIKQIYTPGAHILICSDGHVFADLIQVDDTTINRYAGVLQQMLVQENISCISIFHLGQVCKGHDDHQRRRHLELEWGRPAGAVHEELLSCAAQLQLYRGITRFLFEDASDSCALSKSALQRLARLRAVSVIQRSQAWSNLIQHHFPRSVRLSIHPQPANSSKLGMLLLSATDRWMTPWHAVLVESRHGFTLMKHCEAKQVGRLIEIDGRPSHYQVPP